MIRDIQLDIEKIQSNTALWHELNFGSRIEALDYLEFYIIDRIDALLQLSNPPVELFLLKQNAHNIKSQLEVIDVALFERLRVAIRGGDYRGAALLELMNLYVASSLISQPNNPVVGYDDLDVFTNGLFPTQILPSATQEREPEMVFYQKTPTRIILELGAKAKLTSEDVFYDLGSGLGHVCILVNLLTGTTTRGIDVEPAYCTYANSCAADLDLPDVLFICNDARVADYADGTVFFLYTPFEGQLLQDVLDKLQMVSENKSIRLFTYGPCTAHIAQQNWLTCTGQVSDYLDQLAEFRSCSAG